MSEKMQLTADGVANEGETGDALASQREHPRRQFVKTSLAAGFAAAASPINVRAVIQTDAAGLTVGDVRIPVTRNYQMPGYRAQPTEGSRLPTILVVHEIFGVHEHIRDVCRRFAKLGYLAVAPDLFARFGNAAAMADMNTLVREVVSRTSDSEVLGDLDATASWAASHGGDPARQGVTGFCWGGRITWLYAIHQPALKAAVAWYGRLIGDATRNQPAQPIELVAALQVPVLGLYGGADSGIPVETIERMKQALAAAPPPGAESQFVIYPGASHAFFADYRPNYNEAAARDAWSRCLDWFRKHGLS